MSSPTAIKLAISPRRSLPSTPNKRRVTPSAEQSPSKRALVLTTPRKKPAISQGKLRLEGFSPFRQLFPSNVANNGKTRTVLDWLWHGVPGANARGLSYIDLEMEDFRTPMVLGTPNVEAIPRMLSKYADQFE
ncbi:hypothetical protein F5Y10DRAFT_259907 [Nemania abortiva]|nr:hypothetical protein F5Y10DRAFT_259907 [Nemania abortiva]